jgi:hypothetical protein
MAFSAQLMPSFPGHSIPCRDSNWGVLYQEIGSEPNRKCRLAESSSADGVLGLQLRGLTEPEGDAMNLAIPPRACSSDG